MVCLVGLGNPGPTYSETRHNVGFQVLDLLAERHEARISRQRFRAVYGQVTIGEARCLLVKPLTFMNDSGEAVGRLAYFYQVPPSDILLIYDDLALPLGALRFRRGGSAAGHNGVRSVITHLKTDAFPRLRLGIGAAPPRMDARDYVLSAFKHEERPVAREMIERAAQAVEQYLRDGLEAAMNAYNG